MMELDYEDWCRVLSEHLFRRDSIVREGFFLHVEPGDLLTAVEAELTRPGSNLSIPDRLPEEGEVVDGLFRAVRKRGGGDWWSWSRFDAAGDRDAVVLPLLVAQVLAAFEMSDADDGSYSEAAYWPRLCERLGYAADKKAGGKLIVEPGDEREVYQCLWREVYPSWLRSLDPPVEPKLPERKGYGKKNRHVCLPLSQVLLRDVDIERLPHVFRAARLSPGGTLSDAGAERLVFSYGCDRGFFKAHAARVFDDPVRRPAAVRQVAEAFGEWDGSSRNIAAPARVPRREAELVIGLTRDGSAPTVSIMGWDAGRTLICPRLPPDRVGELLRSGGRTSDVLIPPPAGRPVHLRFRPRSDWVLAGWDDFAGGFLTSAAVSPGDEVLLIAHGKELHRWSGSADRVADGAVRRFLSGESRGSWSRVDGLPGGWGLLRLRLRENLSSAPYPWDRVVRERERVRLVGGLRLRDGSFLAGAGPTVAASAECDVTVNGEPVLPSSGAATQDSPGPHVVEGPGGRRRFVVRDERLPGAYPIAGHAFEPGEPFWPQRIPVPRSRGVARGLLVLGDLRASRSVASRPCETAEAAAIRLLLGRSRACPPANRLPDHPVVATLSKTRTAFAPFQFRPPQQTGRS